MQNVKAVGATVAEVATFHTSFCPRCWVYKTMVSGVSMMVMSCGSKLLPKPFLITENGQLFPPFCVVSQLLHSTSDIVANCSVILFTTLSMNLFKLIQLFALSLRDSHSLWDSVHVEHRS